VLARSSKLCGDVGLYDTSQAPLAFGRDLIEWAKSVGLFIAGRSEFQRERNRPVGLARKSAARHTALRRERLEERF
jgi:hypothetical protein